MNSTTKEYREAGTRLFALNHALLFDNYCDTKWMPVTIENQKLSDAAKVLFNNRLHLFEIISSIVGNFSVIPSVSVIFSNQYSTANNSV